MASRLERTLTLSDTLLLVHTARTACYLPRVLPLAFHVPSHAASRHCPGQQSPLPPNAIVFDFHRHPVSGPIHSVQICTRVYRMECTSKHIGVASGYAAGTLVAGLPARAQHSTCIPVAFLNCFLSLPFVVVSFPVRICSPVCRVPCAQTQVKRRARSVSSIWLLS